MRHRILLAVAFLYLGVSNVIWIVRDTRPPFWDMATHATGALRVYDAFARAGPLAIAAIPLRHLTGPYPPLYHTAIAATWTAFGKSIRVARLANLVAIAIGLLSTYGIGRFLFEPWNAAIAGVLVSFYPVMLWLSRETMIDYWLVAVVAAAIWLLLKTDGFSNKRWSIAFGIVAGLGMLTKWTFPFFVILPALWMARRNWRNAILAGSIAAVFTAYWYIPSIDTLREFLSINAAGGTFEGDPPRLSLGALVFYIRALEGYQLFFPLFVAFVVGAVLLKSRNRNRWIPILLWLAGGWIGLMIFRNKDPRYSAPLLPAIALITALTFERWRVLVPALLLFLVFQHYLVSFGIKSLPESMVIMKGVEGQLSWDWNLYTQSYFGLWGRPARENWQIEDILTKICAADEIRPLRLGLVPDIPRFDSQAFQFYIGLHKLPVQLIRAAVFDQTALLANHYVLVAEKDVEHEASFVPNPQVSTYIFDHPEKFQIAEGFPLPNGDVIRLYKVQ